MPEKSIYTKKYQSVIDMLIEERIKQSLTQAQIAFLLQKPQSYVAKYELCERRLDIAEFMEICQALALRPSKVMVLTQ